MADTYESAIAEFLTADGRVFIAPQFEIAFDREHQDGGACPDFVALDFRNRQIVIVEVSSAWNLDALMARIRNRQQQWYGPIRRRLLDLAPIDQSWPIRFLGFVREERLGYAKRAFIRETDVAFFSIENASFPWVYWQNRLKDGLPV